MNWKSTAVVSGATLLATWLGWTSTPQHVPAATGASTPLRDARQVGGVDIQEQARKLEHRVRSEVEYRDPTRNPFVFGHKLPAPSRTASTPRAAEPVAVPAPAAPPVFNVKLAGIAANSVDGATQRTAIFDAPTGVVLAKEGDRVGSFTVAHVTDTSVDLVDADGVGRTLTLKP